VKPLLKWAGGKRWLIPHIKPLWERAKQDGALCLVEPFAGGGAVSFGLKPKRAILNDLNPHLINFYRWVRDGLPDVTREHLPLDAESYLETRTAFNALVTFEAKPALAQSKPAALLFYKLNRTCYNGLWRVNAGGQFNVPWGKYKNPRCAESFAPYRKLMENWIMTPLSFHVVLLPPRCLVYADPPYDAGFTSYTPNGFSWEDQVHTAEYFAKHSGPVALSNKATPRIVELYTDLGYSLTYFDAPRRIAQNGDRTPVKEVLATLNI
jgi:DNA adenine methylase